MFLSAIQSRISCMAWCIKGSCLWCCIRYAHCLSLLCMGILTYFNRMLISDDINNKWEERTGQLVKLPIEIASVLIHACPSNVNTSIIRLYWQLADVETHIKKVMIQYASTRNMIVRIVILVMRVLQMPGRSCGQYYSQPHTLPVYIVTGVTHTIAPQAINACAISSVGEAWWLRDDESLVKV